MYKDKKTQRESNRGASQRLRDKKKGVIPPENVIPSASYPPTDYRYYLTPPDTKDLVPQDYVKALRSLPVLVQMGILRTLAARRELKLFDDSERRIEAAVAYNEKPRVVPEKPVLMAVK